MGDAKVRCLGCGAKNTDALADRCRVCGTILPNATRRRAAKLGASTDGPAFSVLVENELAAWKDYEDGRNKMGSKSRQPTDVDEPAASRLPWRRGKSD